MHQTNPHITEGFLSLNKVREFLGKLNNHIKTQSKRLQFVKRFLLLHLSTI